MRLASSQIIITLEELIASGITTDQYKWARSNNRLQATRPCKGHPVEITFDTMPDEFKARFEKHHGNPHQVILLNQLLTDDEAASTFFHGYRLPDGKGLSVPCINKYITQAKWLNLLAKARGIAAQLNISTQQLHELVIKIFTGNNIALPRAYAPLKRKLRRYSAEGYLSLVEAWRFNNGHSKKMCAEQQQYLIALMSDPHKPPVEHVYGLMLQHMAPKGHPELVEGSNSQTSNPQTQGWKPVCLETVRSFLMRPNIMRQWFAGRHDEIAYRNQYEYTFTRRKASGRNALWVADGTAVNLIYNTADGKVETKLYVVWIADAHSRMVVGSQISFSEDSETIYQAFNNACRTTGALPHQLLYDNGKAFLSKAIQELSGRMAHRSFTSQPYNGKSKIIENMTRWIEDYVMRYHDGFRGMNRVGTRREDSKKNEDFMARLHKQGQLPGMSEAVCDFYYMLSLYNRHYTKAYLHMQTDDGVSISDGSPKAIYQAAEEKGTRISELELVNVFWWNKPDIQYKNYGMKLEFAKREYYYEVRGADGLYDQEFFRNNIGARFDVKFDPNDMGYIYLYQNNQFITVAYDKYRAPEAQVDYREGDGQRIQQTINKRKADTASAIEEAQELHALNNIQLGFRIADKNELIESDALDQINFLKRKRAVLNAEKAVANIEEDLKGASLYTQKATFKPISNED